MTTQEAIERLKRYLIGNYSKQGCEALNLAISVLEAQQADMWIPMSSGKLSDSIGETVLLTVKTDRGISHGNGSIDIAYLRNNEKRIFYGTTEQYSFDDVIAWKLLPTPYKEET